MSTHASPLCDAVKFERALEELYRTMWSRWCEAQSRRGAA